MNNDVTTETADDRAPLTAEEAQRRVNAAAREFAARFDHGEISQEQLDRYRAARAQLAMVETHRQRDSTHWSTDRATMALTPEELAEIEPSLGLPFARDLLIQRLGEITEGLENPRPRLVAKSARMNAEVQAIDSLPRLLATVKGMEQEVGNLQLERDVAHEQLTEIRGVVGAKDDEIAAIAVRRALAERDAEIARLNHLLDEQDIPF